jgi:uncharacterized protein
VNIRTDSTDVLSRFVREQPNPLLFATVSGAHLYGFPSRDSDFDLRGVHLLPLGEVVGLEQGVQTIEVSEVRDGVDVDLVTHEARKFFMLLLKPNGYVLEQLYSPLVVCTSPAHAELLSIAVGCITRRHAHHYRGFALTQWGLFVKERRVKPLLYLYRVLLTGIHLMRTGTVEANLRHLNEEFQLPQVPHLLELKTTGVERSRLDDKDISFHEREYGRLLEVLDEAAETSILPDQPSAQGALDDLLVRLRLASRLGALETSVQ